MNFLLPHAEFAENLSIYDYFHKRREDLSTERREEKVDPTNELKKQDPSTEQKDPNTKQKKDDQEETSIELKWAMQIAEGKLQSVGKDQCWVLPYCILCAFLS